MHTHTHTHQTNHNIQAFSSEFYASLSLWGLIFIAALKSKKAGTSQVSWLTSLSESREYTKPQVGVKFTQEPVSLPSRVLYLKRENIFLVHLNVWQTDKLKMFPPRAVDEFPLLL